MKPTDTHLAILAMNLLAAIGATATGQPWWFSAVSIVAGTLTTLTYQASGAMETNPPRRGTGTIAAAEFLILVTMIASAGLSAHIFGCAVRLCGFFTQLSEIGKILKPTTPQNDEPE